MPLEENGDGSTLTTPRVSATESRAREGMASFVVRAAQEKLGRCPRCMATSGVLVIATWGIVVGVTRWSPTSVAFIVLLADVAVLCTLLAAAHVVSYLHRRFTERRLTRGGAPLHAREESSRLTTEPPTTARSRKPCCGKLV
jgi:hypothetical protein